MDQDREIEAFFEQALQMTREAVAAQVEQYAPTMFDFHPLPWREDSLGLQGLDAEGKSVFIVAGNEPGRCRELRAEIVRRVNVHQDLVDALKRIANPNEHGDPAPKEAAFIRWIARAVLAKLEGGE